MKLSRRGKSARRGRHTKRAGKHLRYKGKKVRGSKRYHRGHKRTHKRGRRLQRGGELKLTPYQKAKVEEIRKKIRKGDYIRPFNFIDGTQSDYMGDYELNGEIYSMFISSEYTKRIYLCKKGIILKATITDLKNILPFTASEIDQDGITIFDSDTEGLKTKVKVFDKNDKNTESVILLQEIINNPNIPSQESK
jgi:hypothetical protein